MQKYSDEDWELFRNKYPEWIERYMGQMIASYQTILDTDTTASNKFWTLEQRIHQDRLSAGAILPFRMTRGNMLYNLKALLRDGVIGMEELDEFSLAFRRELSREMKEHLW